MKFTLVTIKLRAASLPISDWISLRGEEEGGNEKEITREREGRNGSQGGSSGEARDAGIRMQEKKINFLFTARCRIVPIRWF